MQYLANIIMWVITPFIFLITRNPLTGPWRIFFALGALLWLVVDSFLFSKDNQKRKLFDVIIFALFLIGATNWFYSPFFFLFYLLAIGITFIFSTSAGLGFIVSLVLLFMFNVGEVDVAYDSLILLSLLGTFPVAMYLRKEYLRLQEGQKHILILKKQAESANTTVEELLSNIVTYASAELRQPLINIKNYSHVLITAKKLSTEKMQTYLNRIYTSAQNALLQINKFDEESTGMKIKSSL
ncbi:MAG: hypothetical protein ACD_19C00355G0003 [uncultured bacterium]|nr:MAG: hypothetical protein ACD_19C00355G0003 [uncultured bacterium]